MKQSGHLNPSEGTGCPATSKYGMAPPNKHGGVCRQQQHFRHTKTQTKHMEGALRCALGSQAQHPHSFEDHTWSIQQSTTTHTKHFHNIQHQNSNYTQTHCKLFHQTIHKHCQARNTQNKPDTLTGQHKTS